MGGICLLEAIFPTQGSNPGLPHCRWILYQLGYKGSPTEEIGGALFEGVLYLKKREITSGSPVQPVNQFFSFNINKMLKYLWICLMIFSLIVYVKMLFLSSLSLVTSEKENIKITKLFQNQYL